MTDVFLERVFEPPLTPAEVHARALAASSCFTMHGVEWRQSSLAIDGRKMICWLQAPDMESVRIALRQSDIDMRVCWRGSVHDRPALAAAALNAANVLVERRFDDAVTLQEIQAIEDRGSGCLESRNVHFVRTYFSADQRRMICYYRAPDADSVRVAQRQAGVPFTEAWSFLTVRPEDTP